uniref:NADH dehydrogenase subunit 3 n=1 Tax=Menacanthus cornutus TaxID=1491751 RepID=UPI002000C63C|nr:NADH dehydrogenase subunit 3 [Menacanthus cornutus]UNZ12997.1 NADH dehydrogenase subunit 3 [Menacanthus cornutus]
MTIISSMLTLIFILILIPIILFSLSSFFVESTKFNSSYDTVFECGFEPMFNTRTPFSNQFFQITIVFLIFDLEIIMFLPFMNYNWWSNDYYSLSFMVFVVYIGLLIEWYDNSLEWNL